MAATDISLSEEPQEFSESKNVAYRGASGAKNAQQQIEMETGKSPISKLNAKGLGQVQLNIEEKDGEEEK